MIDKIMTGEMVEYLNTIYPAYILFFPVKNTYSYAKLDF